MTEINQDVSIYQGDAREIDILIRDENGSILDLTGYSAIWVVANPNTMEILLTKTTVSGITIPYPTSGILTVSLLPEDTRLMKPADWYYHEVKVTDSCLNPVTVTTGDFEVVKSLANG